MQRGDLVLTLNESFTKRRPLKLDRDMRLTLEEETCV